jgi:hypothetical protein
LPYCLGTSRSVGRGATSFGLGASPWARVPSAESACEIQALSNPGSHSPRFPVDARPWRQRLLGRPGRHGPRSNGDETLIGSLLHIFMSVSKMSLGEKRDLSGGFLRFIEIAWP